MQHMMLPPPAAVPDQPLGPERGGVFDAPWVSQAYFDARYPTMPTNAPPARNIPLNRYGQPMAFARLSVNGMGEYITSQLSPSPTRPIAQARTRATQPVPRPTERLGIFGSPWLSPNIDAAMVTDLARETPGWVRMQEQAVTITGPPTAGIGQVMRHHRGPRPMPLIHESVFATYR